MSNLIGLQLWWTKQHDCSTFGSSGGSYWTIQSTSGISRPLAATSVQRRMPESALQNWKNVVVLLVCFCFPCKFVKTKVGFCRVFKRAAQIQSIPYGFTLYTNTHTSNTDFDKKKNPHISAFNTFLRKEKTFLSQNYNYYIHLKCDLLWSHKPRISAY